MTEARDFVRDATRVVQRYQDRIILRDRDEIAWAVAGLMERAYSMGKACGGAEYERAMRDPQVTPRLRALLERCCKRMGVKVEQVAGYDNRSLPSRARKLFSHCAVQSGYTDTQIALALGGRTRESARWCARSGREMVAKDLAFSRLVQLIMDAHKKDAA